MSIKIIVNIFYKPNAFLESLLEADANRLYVPINGGNSLAGKYQKPWLLSDSTGENISYQNHMLNEMTSIYWFWKNYDWKSLDYVGFNHYRRLFNPKDLSDVDSYDGIVSEPLQLNGYTVYEQYQHAHNIYDLDILLSLLKSVGHSCYSKFKKYVDTSKMLYAPCNMFVLKSSLFERYCNFIFPIFRCLVQRVSLGKDKYQHRAIAFLGERLTSFWLRNLSNSYKVKEVPLEFIDENSISMHSKK